MLYNIELHDEMLSHATKGHPVPWENECCCTMLSHATRCRVMPHDTEWHCMIPSHAIRTPWDVELHNENVEWYNGSLWARSSPNDSYMLLSEPRWCQFVPWDAAGVLLHGMSRDAKWHQVASRDVVFRCRSVHVVVGRRGLLNATGKLGATIGCRVEAQVNEERGLGHQGTLCDDESMMKSKPQGKQPSS